MQERLLGFVDALRSAGVTPSPAETLDAAAAVAAGGVERQVLRECLAATLVKDHADRPLFDQLFDRYFALPARERGKGKRERPAEFGEGATSGQGDGAKLGQQPEDGEGHVEKERREQQKAQQRREAERAQQLARRRDLTEMPFREMDPREIEEIEEFLAELARLFRRRCARRMRRANRGRLDMRRTIRRGLGRGGVPIELLFRRPRPRKTDLVALVDLSYSTRTASEFMLALLAPARHYFRRVTQLAYVDAIAEISYEGGHVVPNEKLDVNARSDFGRVLLRLAERYETTLGRNTVLLILGDARNNRRAPRADLLARTRTQVRRVVWLNPEVPDRWDTGDSVMSTYARHIDAVLPAFNLKTLLTALDSLV